MARSGGYVVLALYDGSAPEPYQVRRGGDGVLYCTCRGWLSNLNANKRTGSREPAQCKHTKDYVSLHPGTIYGIQWASKSAPALVQGKVKKAVVYAPATVKPAPANWRALLLAESVKAAARGVVTPAVAAAAFVQEIGTLLDLEEPIAVAGIAVAPAHALDLDEEG